MPSLKSLVIILCLCTGCRSEIQTTGASISSLRTEWTRQRAYEIGEPLGKAFDGYHKTIGSPRGREFEALGMTINLTQPLISGKEALDLLGTPDLWRSEGENTGFVYFFEGANRKASVLHVEISRDGRTIKELGWNSAGIRDYRKEGFHS